MVPRADAVEIDHRVKGPHGLDRCRAPRRVVLPGEGRPAQLRVPEAVARVIDGLAARVLS